jgi:hypothetical protein
MGNPFLIAEDEAIKTYLQGMTVTDEKSESATGNTGVSKVRPIKVWFGYPDVEIATQTYPFITIDLVDIVPANDRQTSGRLSDSDYRGTIASVPGQSYEYDIPVAYDLVYQLTTHARHPRHDRSILFQMWNKFPSKFGKLAVSNQLGTEAAVRSMFVDGFVKRDTFNSEDGGNRRLLRNVFTVRVVSEMTPAVAAQASKATESVIINVPTNNSSIPSAYTIVK